MPIDRIIPNLSASIMRFILDTQYTVGIITGTILDAFPALAVIPGYPDDLLKLNTPTIGIASPSLIQSTEQYYGEEVQGQEISIDLYGFVVRQGKDHANKIYRDRLLNDIFWLFDHVARHEGLPIYDQITKSEIGQCEVIEVRARNLPANVPEVEAERYKFHLEVDIAYMWEVAT